MKHRLFKIKFFIGLLFGIIFFVSTKFTYGINYTEWADRNGISRFFFIDTIPYENMIIFQCIGENGYANYYAVDKTTDLSALDINNLLIDPGVYLIDSECFKGKLMYTLLVSEIDSLFRGCDFVNTKGVYMKKLNYSDKNPGIRFCEYTKRPYGFLVVLIEGNLFDWAWIDGPPPMIRNDRYAYYKYLVPLWHDNEWEEYIPSDTLR